MIRVIIEILNTKVTENSFEKRKQYQTVKIQTVPKKK